jgi:hypothetical protein
MAIATVVAIANQALFPSSQRCPFSCGVSVILGSF